MNTEPESISSIVTDWTARYVAIRDGLRSEEMGADQANRLLHGLNAELTWFGNEGRQDEMAEAPGAKELSTVVLETMGVVVQGAIKEMMR